MSVDAERLKTMNRDVFVRSMKDKNIKLADSTRNKIIEFSLKNCTPTEKYIVIMEELSELIKETSKAARGEADNMGILEELADVHICLSYLAILSGISSKELNKAIDIKLMREFNRRNGGFLDKKPY